MCLGRDNEARLLRDQLLDRAVERYVSPYAIARMEAALGNTDSALEWLKREMEERDSILSGIVTSSTPITADDPRFSDFLRGCSPAPETG